VNEIVHIWAYEESHRSHQTSRRDGGRSRTSSLFAEEPRIYEAREKQDIGADLFFTHEVREHHGKLTSTP
jgi:hypothetical protein